MPGACALLAATLAAHAALADSSFRAAVGYDYSSGSYGGSQTIDETYVPLTGAYRVDQFEVRVTVPYVSVSGPATIVDATGEFAPGPGGTHSGLGDVIAAATVYDVLHSDEARFYVDMSARIKFGTADAAQGLGTGENDYAAQIDALKEFDRFGLFATAGYIVRGSPTLLRLRNVAYGGVGADMLFTDGVRAGVSFDYRPSAIPGDDPIEQASIFLILSGPHHMTIRPYLAAGFTNSTPSWGAGVSIGWKSAPRDWIEPREP